MQLARVTMLVLAALARVASAAPSPTFERALKLYDRKAMLSATIELQKVLDRETNDDAASVQRAEYVMAKALFQAGYYAASFAAFAGIVHTAGHGYRTTTLKWLVELGTTLGNDRVLDLVAAYDPRDFDDPSVGVSTPDVHYLAGLLALRRDDVAGAIAQLASVPDSAFSFEAARLELGFAHAHLHEADAAIAAWAPIRRDDERDLAALATGELHLRAGAWDDATAAFGQVSRSGPFAARAAWEASWVELRRANVATGGDDLFAPATTGAAARAAMEVPWLITLEVCAAGHPVDDVVAAFRDDHVALQRELGTLLGGATDDAALFARVVAPVRAGTATLGSRRLRAYLRTLFGSPPMAAAMAWDDELAAELKHVDDGDKAWRTTRVGELVLAYLTAAKAEADVAAARLARARIARARDRLGELMRTTAKLPAAVGGAAGALAVTCP